MNMGRIFVFVVLVSVLFVGVVLSQDSTHYRLERGWNLIGGAGRQMSVCWIEANENVISPVYQYDPELRRYVPSDRYLMPLHGYWVLSLDTLTIAVPLDTASVYENAYNLRQGWNLIGGAAVANPTHIFERASSVIEPIYGYNPIEREYEAAEFLLPNIGYWVLSEATVSLTIPDTLCPCIDFEGYVYRIVMIGDQCWMAENLNTLRYKTGWGINYYHAMRWDDFGVFYEFNAASNSSICPFGWRIPSDEDWKELERYLGMCEAEIESIGWRGTNEGGKLKETGFEYWHEPNTGASNESGFSALGMGRANFIHPDDHHSWEYHTEGYILASFWSYPDRFVRQLRHDRTDVRRVFGHNLEGLSIRCIKHNLGVSIETHFPEFDTVHNICEGDLIELTAIVEGGYPPYQFDWAGDGVFEDSSTIVITLPIGSNTFTVSVRDSMSTTVSSFVEVDVEDCPPDVTPPCVIFNLPEDGDTIDRRNTFCFTISDYCDTTEFNRGVDRESIDIDITGTDSDEVSYREVNWVPDIDILGGTICVIPDDWLIGDYEVCISFSDYSGNSTSHCINFTIIEYEIDSTCFCTDPDGNSYRTVWIGDQCWMAENLRTTKDKEGNRLSGGYSYDPPLNYYIDSPSHFDRYGYLYNSNVSVYTMPRCISTYCPHGWRLPAEEDWLFLIEHLGGEDIAGGKMKEANWLHWRIPNTGATDESNFSALPAGEVFPIRPDEGFEYTNRLEGAGFYTRFAGEVEVVLNHDSQTATITPPSGSHGLSIRCVQHLLSASDSVHLVCEGDTTEIYPIVEGGHPPYQYDWNGDGTFVDTPLTELLPVGTHTYTVIVRDARITYTDSAVVTVIVEECDD